jgi:flagellar protein FliS
MLYDRLVLDLERAELAQRAGEREKANEQLAHAQDIVIALQDGLRPELWDGGPALASIYTFLHSELIRANVQNDVAATAACRALVEPLRDAWHEAARMTAAEASGA